MMAVAAGELKMVAHVIGILILVSAYVTGANDCLGCSSSSFNSKSIIAISNTMHDNNTEDNKLDPTEVITKLMERLRNLLRYGDKQNNITALDPKQFSYNYSIDDENLRMSIDLEGQVANVSNLFWENIYTCPLTMQVQMSLSVEDLVVNGTYNLTGMAYDVFPIFGDGKFLMNIDQINFMVTTEVSPKEGDYPLQMDNLTVHFLDLQGLKMNFENLMGDDDVSLLLSQLAGDISEKLAYNVVSRLENSSNTMLYEMVADQIEKITLLDIVSSINKI